MKGILLSALVASSLLAELNISSNGSSITFDASSESGDLSYIVVYKNGSYTKISRTKTFSIPYSDGEFKAVMSISENGVRRSLIRKKQFGAVNEKPVINLQLSVNGSEFVYDLSNSIDNDGTIVKYLSYLYKDGKFIGSYYGNTRSMTLEDGSYKIISKIVDNDGGYSLTSRNFEIKNIVTRERDYTLGTPSIVNVNDIYTTEYYAQGRTSFHDVLGTWAAYVQGWTGEGVSVAVIDSGIDTDHIDLDDNIAGVYSVLDYSDGEDDNKHGTMVSGIIAAEKNDIGIHGIAYNADIYSIKVLNNYASGNQYDVAKGVTLATDLGVKVSNISIGGSYPGDYTSYIDAYKYAIENDNSIIVAAGNQGTSCEYVNGSFVGCNFPAALPLLDPSLLEGSGAWISVGSVNSDGTMTYYSNTAGLTADFYMVAPEGGFTYTTAPTEYISSGYTVLGVGTSFAAPMVTGAFALLAQKYPYLEGVDIRDILFASAVDLGDPGVDDVYGHGMLDIEAAMKPIGELNIPVDGTTSSTSKLPVTQTSFVSSSALNLKSSNLSSVVALDDFNRGYNVDVSASVSESVYAYDVNKFQDVKFGNVIVGLNEAEQSIMLGYDFGNFKYKLAIENDVFGSSGSGALELSGKTYYSTIQTKYKSLDFSITYGYVDANVGGLFKDISAVHGFSADVLYNHEISEKSNFKFGVELPMNVVSGTIKSEIPTTMASSGEIISVNENLDLSGKYSPKFKFEYRYSF